MFLALLNGGGGGGEVISATDWRVANGWSFRRFHTLNRRRENRQLISSVCLWEVHWRTNKSAAFSANVCVLERRKRRGFLLKQTSRLDDDDRGGSEHARKITIGDISSCGRVILRGNSEPDQREGMIYRRRGSLRKGKGGRQTRTTFSP